MVDVVNVKNIEIHLMKLCSWKEPGIFFSKNAMPRKHSVKSWIIFFDFFFGIVKALPEEIIDFFEASSSNSRRPVAARSELQTSGICSPWEERGKKIDSIFFRDSSFILSLWTFTATTTPCMFGRGCRLTAPELREKRPQWPTLKRTNKY